MALRDYRQMVTEIRPNCDHCAILVGYGWGGAAAACVLYEAKSFGCLLLNVGDTVEQVDRASVLALHLPDPDGSTHHSARRGICTNTRRF